MVFTVKMVTNTETDPLEDMVSQELECFSSYKKIQKKVNVGKCLKYFWDVDI